MRFLFKHTHSLPHYDDDIRMPRSSNFSVLRRETRVHARDRSGGDATAHGDDSAADTAHANGHTESAPVSASQWLRHEHTAAADTQAGVEAAEGLGGLRQVLRAHAAPEFRRHTPAAADPADRGAQNGPGHAGTAPRARRVVRR